MLSKRYEAKKKQQPQDLTSCAVEIVRSTSSDIHRLYLIQKESSTSCTVLKLSQYLPYSPSGYSTLISFKENLYKII